MYLLFFLFIIGYVFHSVEEIKPYLEDTYNGPSVLWAKEKGKRLKRKNIIGIKYIGFVLFLYTFFSFLCIYIAVELNCYIAVGYPEKHQTKDQVKYYNSMCFVNRQGELIKTYRKTFLYETDENWAEEGESFDTMMIPEFGKVKKISIVLLKFLFF